jgi:hypothetical protein
MPDRKSKKRTEDANETAARILREVTDEEQEPTEAERKEAARILGRIGGRKGGKARAKKLTAEQRSEIARLAAKARWKKTD